MPYALKNRTRSSKQITIMRSHPESPTRRRSPLTSSKKYHRKQRLTLLGHRMGRNVLDSVLNAGNLIGFGVGNFNGKFVLNGHYDLNGIEGVKTKIISEFRRGGNLGRVDLIKVFDDCDDAVCNLAGVDEGLRSTSSKILCVYPAMTTQSQEKITHPKDDIRRGKIETQAALEYVDISEGKAQPRYMYTRI